MTQENADGAEIPPPGSSKDGCEWIQQKLDGTSPSSLISSIIELYHLLRSWLTQKPGICLLFPFSITRGTQSFSFDSPPKIHPNLLDSCYSLASLNWFNLMTPNMFIISKLDRCRLIHPPAMEIFLNSKYDLASFLIPSFYTSPISFRASPNLSAFLADISYLLLHHLYPHVSWNNLHSEGLDIAMLLRLTQIHQGWTSTISHSPPLPWLILSSSPRLRSGTSPSGSDCWTLPSGSVPSSGLCQPLTLPTMLCYHLKSITGLGFSWTDLLSLVSVPSVLSYIYSYRYMLIRLKINFYFLCFFSISLWGVFQKMSHFLSLCPWLIQYSDISFSF